MQPFDYRLAVQNPVQMALQGYMQGQQMVGQREEAAMNRELFDLKKQEFQMGQQKLAQEQAQAQAMQTDLAGFAERLATNAATIDDVISLSAKYPEIGEQVQASWTMKSDADKEATKKELVRFGSALKFSPDVAARLISERVTALEENGAPEALAAAQNIKGYLDMGMPEAALASIVLQANNVMKPEEFEAFSSVIMPKRPEAAGAVGKIIQDWENGYYEKLYGPEGAREAALADIKAAQEGKPLVQNIVGGELSPGFKKRDELFAQIALDWETGGGSDALKQLVQIEDVIGRIDRGENVSGGVSGFSPDLLRAFADPNAQDAKDTVEEVVQRNLKAILGAQFTAQEGGELIKRAFNARLSPEINRKRLQRLFTQMRLAAEQKQAMTNFFNQNGTLQGYQGKQPSMADFYTALDAPADTNELTIDEVLEMMPE
jgi:hypothetical protein